MMPLVKFYRASGPDLGRLLKFAEEHLNAALERELPNSAVLRSIQPVLYQMDEDYHLVMTLLIDMPDDTPRERLGFKIE